MPKLVDKKTRLEIIEFAKGRKQGEVAKQFNVSRMYVNAVVNNRPILRNNGRSKTRCMRTGFLI